MPVTVGQSHRNALRQRVAVMSALVLLWLSAGATLTHTDTCFEGLGSVPSGARTCVLSTTGSPESLLPCAACEWNALQVVTPAVFVLAFSLVRVRERYDCGGTDAVRQLVIFASLRAPPAFL